MKLNFIANGYHNLKKEVKENVIKKYQSELNNAGLIRRIRIRLYIKFEVRKELARLQKKVSSKSLFFKK